MSQEVKKIPRHSPHCLIQESLYPNEWLVLVVCMMLNCTTRKQVEKVLPEFMRRWPNARDFIVAEPTEIADVIRSLGFANRRSQNLLKMTRHYLAGPWEHASELHGIGEYGARCWEMLFRCEVGKTVPKDHALLEYWDYVRRFDDGS